MVEDSNERQEIPGMNLENKYSEKKPAIQESNEKVQKEMEKTKKEIEKLKSFILKKYPFTQAIGILPPQSIKFFIDEEEVPKETEKYIHLNVIIPEEKIKKMSEMKKDIVKEIGKQKIWLNIKTPVDIWEVCLDSKFELAGAIAMSFPIYDKGILGALRVAEIHKSLVLQKFEKYVVSYVIGGSLIRGDTVKTSDVDVFVIINDTDVKRMPRVELKERLRSMIYQYVAEATALAGVKNILNVQVYLLTDFWESVKDAHPVMFTFIRDGVPLYDRGTFLPWKALLKMGRLKPSPEAIDMFMSMGDNTVKRVKRTLLDLVLSEIYWSVITPSQALLMLYGLPPPTPKQVVGDMKDTFMTKEKMLEKRYIDILEKIVIKYYKGYEHEKIKEVSGKEIDVLLQDVEDYLKRLKELREQIEKRTQEKTIEQIYNDLFHLLEAIFGKKSQAAILSEFENEMVKKGKFTEQHLRTLKNIISSKTEFKKGKSNPHKVDEARKNASILINDLIEYSQRCELLPLEKGKMRLKYKKSGKDYTAELLICSGEGFLFEERSIKKITDKISDSNMKEVNDAVSRQKAKKDLEINPKIFELLKKELGNYEIVL
ncbi:MAG: nucleotidyltransferase domain-containing protein [Nanoarchaeota archaeon]|nr:nucleotidyltransferase domain-containing protein [Nanoarchaeota archaeon]